MVWIDVLLWLCFLVLVDVGNCMGYVCFVIDYVLVIYYDGWNFGDVKVLGIDDVLVSDVDLVLYVCIV